VSSQTDAVAAAAIDLANAVAASATDPADRIRLLLPLASWVAPTIPGNGPLSALATQAQDAIASAVRCAACGALGQATAAYQPLSYQDAMAVRQAVCGALDAEATRCADANRVASYDALTDLRVAVAADLEQRGAALAWLVEVTTAQSMPSLAEAFSLYGDTTREPQLVASAAIRHPLFMPLDFVALNE